MWAQCKFFPKAANGQSRPTLTVGMGVYSLSNSLQLRDGTLEIESKELKFLGCLRTYVSIGFTLPKFLKIMY